MGGGIGNNQGQHHGGVKTTPVGQSGNSGLKRHSEDESGRSPKRHKPEANP